MRVWIEWTYIKSGDELIFRSEEIEAVQAVGIAEDLQRTGRAQKITLIDELDSSWTIKQMKKYLKSVDTEPHNLVVYFDGGFDHQTKMAGLGCVIYYEQNGKSFRLRKNARIEGLKSSNEAEYAALHLCMRELAYLGAHHLPVRIMGDSRVVINHLTEEWPAIEKNLSDWADKIEDELKVLHLHPDYYLINRNSNKEADRLATQALDGVEILATREIM